jgi:hypothetical protein
VKSSAFTGQINRVELKVGEGERSYLIDPEQHFKVMMARQ